MKILIITGSFPPDKCGVGDYTFHLAESLAYNTNCEVFVITTKNIDMSMESTPSRFHIFRIVHKWNFVGLNDIVSYTQKLNPDIIHIQYPTSQYGNSLIPHYLPFVLKYIYNYKIVETWHEPLSWKGLFRYFPNVLVRDDLIVVLSDYFSYIPFLYRFFLKSKKNHFIPISSNIPTVTLSLDERKEIRNQFIKRKFQRLICYFGFVSPEKGVEKIFDICNPNKDIILLLCELNPYSDKYHKAILDRINSVEWQDKCIVTGYLKPIDIAKYLAVSDAALFPFLTGVTERNGSVLAARNQGTFILTTSRIKKGLNQDENIFYSDIENLENFKIALDLYSGNRIEKTQIQEWKDVAQKHIDVYKTSI